jgi:hypothetical protein
MANASIATAVLVAAQSGAQAFPVIGRLHISRRNGAGLTAR